jgi:photosystem II stability/assembly factor-like uncharacterized protein
MIIKAMRHTTCSLRLAALALGLALTSAGCSNTCPTSGPPVVSPDGGPAPDGGLGSDGGTGTDGGLAPDGGALSDDGGLSSGAIGLAVETDSSGHPNHQSSTLAVTPGLETPAVSGLSGAGELPSVVSVEGVGSNRWTSLGGPYGGYVTDIRFVPGARGTVFAGTQGGGVYRSTDHGATWTPARTGLGIDLVLQIAVQSGGNTLYAAGHRYWFGYGTGGVYKSTDGGQSWSALPVPNLMWNAVLVKADDPQVVLIGGPSGVMRSTDGGATFAPTSLTVTVVDLAADPGNPEIIWASTYGYHMYRSTDGGQTWTRRGQNMPNGNIRAVAVDPSASARVYAAAYDIFGDTGGIYRSEDHGVTWSRVLAARTWRVRVDPTQPALVWATAEGPPFSNRPGLFKSTDRGASWSAITLPTSNQYYAPFAYALAVDPSSRVLVGLYRAGILRSEDGGSSWAFGRLASSGVTAFALHPTNPAIMLVGTFQGGCWRTVNGGVDWTEASSGFGDGSKTVHALAFDPTSPEVVYLGGDSSGVFKSTNGGVTWTPTSLGNYSEVRAIQVAPSSPATVWAGVANTGLTLGAWKSEDSGTTWSRKLAGKAVTALAVHPTNPAIVFAGVSTWASDNQRIYRTENGGDSWTVVYEGPMGVFHSLAIDPADPRIIYATGTPGNVLKSTDSGATWATNIGGLTPAGRVTSLAIDPQNHHRVAVGVNDNGGFYYSDNGGQTWTADHTGLWQRSVTALAMRLLPSGVTVTFLGTMGDGAYSDAPPTPTVASIQGLVFLDLDQTGTRDSTREPGLARVEIRLLQLATGDTSSPLATTRTDASGRYVLRNLRAGAYRVELVPVTGDRVTTQNPVPVTLADGGQAEVNFGLFRPTSTE